jgi:hypothetical protein
MAYNTFLGQPTLSKFMAVPHYTYLVLKIPGLHGVNSIRGDVKRSFDCDREICEMADRLTASAELQDLKQALAKSPGPGHAQGQDLQDVHLVGGLAQQNRPVVHG